MQSLPLHAAVNRVALRRHVGDIARMCAHVHKGGIAHLIARPGALTDCPTNALDILLGTVGFVALEKVLQVAIVTKVRAHGVSIRQTVTLYITVRYLS